VRTLHPCVSPAYGAAVGQLLTVVFVEVDASSELLASVGDERWSAAIDRALEQVRLRVEPYEGSIERVLGDGLMLVFSSPRSAVAFAVAVQQAAIGPLRLRIGMDFGEVAGPGELSGEAVSAAAGISGRAAGGEILVSDVVCRLAGSMPGLRFVDRGRLKLEGRPGRRQLHGVVAAGALDRPAPVFGRDEELERIDDLVASILHGSGRVLLVEGEAGIGKTHLGRVAAVRAEAAGATVVVAGADELEQDRPGGILASVAEGLGVAFDEWTVPDTARPGSDPAHAVVERFVDAVEDAAARRPLLLVAEDLHWADELSLRGVASLVRRTGPLAVGLVGTMRPTPRSPWLLRVLEVAARAGSPTLRLDGLDLPATAGLVASITGAAPGAGLRRRLDATGGNPLFVTELLRTLDDEGALRVDMGVADTDSDTIPDGLVQTLGRSVAALPAGTAEVLRLASLLGGAFALDDLATVVGRSVVDVAGLLREAVDAGLVTGTGNRLAFRHDLVREAVYLGIAPAIRTDLHVSAARALAAAGAPVAHVARQYALGARPGDLVAVGWLLRAARDAMRLDTNAAVSLNEEALALAPPDWSERIEAESTLVELLAWSGRVDDARDLARAVLDRSLTPAEELQARRALGTVFSTVGELTGAAEQMRTAAALSGVTDVERGILRCAAAGMSVIAGLTTPTEAEQVARQHVDTDLPALACWVHNTLAVAAVAAGAYDEQLEHARIACTLLERTHVPPLGFLIPQTWLPTAHYNLDQYDQAEATARGALDHGERHGDLGLVVHASSMLAGLGYVEGRWEDAMATVDAALVLAEETGVTAQTVFLRAIAGLVAVGRGEHELAAEHVTTAESFSASGEHHPFGLDLLLLVRTQLLEIDGDVGAATALLGFGWHQTANLRGLIQWRTLGPELVRLAHVTGDIDLAETVARDVAALAARSSSASGAVAAQRARGLADDDPTELLAALDRSRASPRKVDTAALCEEVAVRLLDAGSRDEGVELLDEALALHETMGAAGHVARLDARLREAGARRRRSRPTAATRGWESLSPKEHEVVALVAAGLSNPEVATRLYISRRTVETHLSHVFRKLGVSNRTQLAAVAVERGLTGADAVTDHVDR